MLNIIRAGIYTSVQDSGRHGFRQSGLSHCGALDKPAFRPLISWSGTMRMPRRWKSLSVNWLSNLKMRPGSLLPAQAARRSWMINRSGPAGDCR